MELKERLRQYEGIAASFQQQSVAQLGQIVQERKAALQGCVDAMNNGTLAFDEEALFKNAMNRVSSRKCEDRHRRALMPPIHGAEHQKPKSIV